MFTDYIKLLRPHHWIKNLLVFLPLMFSLNIFHQHLLMRVVWAFIAFCLAASAIYIFNDFFDQKKDINKNRPFTRMKLNTRYAFLIFIIFLICAFIISCRLEPILGIIIFAYLLYNIFYTLIFKNIFLIDVIFIAFGFVFRILAGAIIIKVEVSIWIILIVFFAAVLIALSKRKLELANINYFFRSAKYKEKILNYLIIITFLIIIILYFFWSINPLIMQKFQTDKLFLSTPLVIVGLLRYLQDVYLKNKFKDPIEIIYNDAILLTIFFCWIISIIIIIYH